MVTVNITFKGESEDVMKGLYKVDQVIANLAEEHEDEEFDTDYDWEDADMWLTLTFRNWYFADEVKDALEDALDKMGVLETITID